MEFTTMNVLKIQNKFHTIWIALNVLHFHQALDIRVREEQRMMDEKIVAEMDQKVIDQQNTLEKAGVPGFYITTNPQVNVHDTALDLGSKWWCHVIVPIHLSTSSIQARQWIYAKSKASLKLV